MEHHRPSLASMQPGVLSCDTHTGIQIYTLNDPTRRRCGVAVRHDQDDVSSYVNSNVFEVGEVVAFRGTDGLPFNLLRVTHNVSLRSLGPRSIVRGDFLVKRDDDNNCYSLDPNWKNASMVYAKCCGMETTGLVTLPLEEAVTVTETSRRMPIVLGTFTYGWIGLL